MKTISSSELKKRFGRYIRLANQGKTFAITIRGETVAFLKPLRPEETQSSATEKLTSSQK
jgi:antitoxin (DNA-binding transcriptional repressor) of toxin-antitoxin stability system